MDDNLLRLILLAHKEMLQLLITRLARSESLVDKLELYALRGGQVAAGYQPSRTDGGRILSDASSALERAHLPGSSDGEGSDSRTE